MTDGPEDDVKGRIADAAGLPNVREVLDIDLDLTRDEKLRATALMMAVSYHKETIVKDGSMYQTMKANGTNLRSSEPRQVIDAAMAFEGYLRGHYNELMLQIVLGTVHAIDDAFAAMPDNEIPG
jgi:hypothetical protein